MNRRFDLRSCSGALLIVATLLLQQACFTTKVNRMGRVDASAADGISNADGVVDAMLDLVAPVDLTDLSQPHDLEIVDGAPDDASDLPDAAETSEGPYPQCTARGGQCHWVATVTANCPPGTYPPFTGSMRFCPTNALGICCVPEKTGGAPCSSEADCTQSSCLRESSGYPPGGVCTMGICNPDAASTTCASWQTCLTVSFSQAPAVCMISCDRDESCREGWSCQALPKKPFVTGSRTTVNVCWAPVGGSKGLGELCGADGECLSSNCLQDPKSQQLRCSASCGVQSPCVAGYECRGLSGCAAPPCDFCFPK